MFIFPVFGARPLSSPLVRSTSGSWSRPVWPSPPSMSRSWPGPLRASPPRTGTWPWTPPVIFWMSPPRWPRPGAGTGPRASRRFGKTSHSYQAAAATTSTAAGCVEGPDRQRGCRSNLIVVWLFSFYKSIAGKKKESYANCFWSGSQ
jgi:hypothetical protein